jgi:hypothetical protein
MDRAFQPQLSQILNCFDAEHAAGGSPLQIRIARTNSWIPLRAKDVFQRLIARNAQTSTGERLRKTARLIAAPQGSRRMPMQTGVLPATTIRKWLYSVCLWFRWMDDISIHQVKPANPRSLCHSSLNRFRICDSK